MTSTPMDRTHSMPPGKFCDSPTMTVRNPNWRTSPLQYQQGASVVTHGETDAFRRAGRQRSYLDLIMGWMGRSVAPGGYVRS